MAEFFYPPVGFHFRVDFGLPLTTVTDTDSRFKDVSGLNITVSTEDLNEGGENRFVHKLPTGVDYSNVTLKRGMSTNSAVIAWVRAQMENFVFRPIDITITLLNQDHAPLRSWMLVNAFPVSWQISDFDAMGEQNYVIETLELEYQYFRVLSLGGISNAVGNAFNS